MRLYKSNAPNTVDIEIDDNGNFQEKKIFEYGLVLTQEDHLPNTKSLLDTYISEFIKEGIEVRMGESRLSRCVTCGDKLAMTKDVHFLFTVYSEDKLAFLEKCIANLVNAIKRQHV